MKREAPNKRANASVGVQGELVPPGRGLGAAPPAGGGAAPHKRGEAERAKPAKKYNGVRRMQTGLPILASSPF